MPQQQRPQGSVIVWALWVLLGVAAALFLISSAFDTADNAFKGKAGPRSEHAAIELPAGTPGSLPAAPEPPPPEPAPAKAETPSSSFGVEGVVSRTEGKVRIYAIAWRAPDGAALRFDARRFYVVGFTRDGARCAFATPVASAWSRSADTVEGGRRTAERRLLSRGDSERLEAEALARRLGIPDATVQECDAVAARVTAQTRSAVAHKARCYGDRYEPISAEDWARLVSAHNRGRTAGVAILAKGLNTPPAALAQLRAGVRAGDYCNAGGGAGDRLLGALVKD